MMIEGHNLFSHLAVSLFKYTGRSAAHRIILIVHCYDTNLNIKEEFVELENHHNGTGGCILVPNKRPSE